MIWPFIPADGFNETGKLASLNDYFPWYFSLFVEEAETYNISLKTLDGDTAITTRGLDDSFGHLSFQQVQKRKKSPLELTIDDELKAAYFRIEDSRVFKDSIQTYFQRILDRGVTSLIIDLRGEGGIREEEHVAELYSYLITKPSKIYESIQVKSNNSTLFDKDFTYKPYANSLKQIKEKYMDRLVDSGNGYLLWQDESYLGLIKPSNIQFKGSVYILTDGRNYSASTDFTSIASQLENVFIVGEETGGEYRSYISGAMFGLVLPNSKIGVKVATWKSILAIEENPANRGRGVMPDYPVSVSLEDFIEGSDVTKEFAYELISRNRKVR
jgi:C-terminal processing protease CtpA/Prc